MKKTYVFLQFLLIGAVCAMASDQWHGIKIYKNGHYKTYYQESVDSIKFYADPMPDLSEVIPEATWEANTSIYEVLEMIATASNFSSNSSICEIGTKTDGSHYIIRGRVISSDKAGNFHYILAVQDETAAISLYITCPYLWAYFPLGQEMMIDLTGLYMGTYYSLPQIVWSTGDSQRSSIPLATFIEHCQKKGQPTDEFEYVSIDGGKPTDKPYCIRTSIGEVSRINMDSMAGYKIANQFIELRDVEFVEGGKNTFANYLTGREILREIKDMEGNSLYLSTSSYSDFCLDPLPTGLLNIRGILSNYNVWEIILNSSEDFTKVTR